MLHEGKPSHKATLGQRFTLLIDGFVQLIGLVESELEIKRISGCCLTVGTCLIGVAGLIVFLLFSLKLASKN